MPNITPLNFIPSCCGIGVMAEDIVLHEGKTMKVILPSNSLADQSIRIEPKSNHRRWQDWTKAEEIESYELLQKIVKIWEKQDIKDYIILGTSSEAKFCWHVIPFTRSGFRFWNQLKVAMRFFLFGGYSVEQDYQNLLLRSYQSVLSVLKEPLKNGTTKFSGKGDDAFCQEKIIESQQVLEGRNIRILYDYKPIAFNHFLAITKRHIKKFSELSLEEYLEEATLSKRIVDLLEKAGYQSYIFHKTGKWAGQVVPHWHQHLIFSHSSQEAIIGKLNVLKKMILGTLPISKTELKERVQTFQKQFSQI